MFWRSKGLMLSKVVRVACYESFTTQMQKRSLKTPQSHCNPLEDRYRDEVAGVSP